MAIALSSQDTFSHLSTQQANLRVQTAVAGQEVARRARDAFAATLPGASRAEGARQAAQERERGLERLRQYAISFNKLQYVVDEKSNDITVRVIDPDTDKVIRVLPPEELRRLGDGLADGGLATEGGVLLNERV